MDTPQADHKLASQLISEVLRSEQTLPEIAASFSLTFSRFLELLKSPFAQAELAALRELSQIRDELRAPLRRENSLARLTHIAAFSLDEPEARRAATTVLRDLKANTRENTASARATDPSSGRCDEPHATVTTAPPHDDSPPTVAHLGTSRIPPLILRSQDPSIPSAFTDSPCTTRSAHSCCCHAP